jgi:hypothetical protein
MGGGALSFSTRFGCRPAIRRQVLKKVGRSSQDHPTCSFNPVLRALRAADKTGFYLHHLVL